MMPSASECLGGRWERGVYKETRINIVVRPHGAVLLVSHYRGHMYNSY